MPTIDLPDDELAAVTAAIRGVIAGDRYPHAPRLDPLRAALARFDAASKLTPAPAKGDKTAAARNHASAPKNGNETKGANKPGARNDDPPVRPASAHTRRPRRQPRPTSGRGDNRCHLRGPGESYSDVGHRLLL